MLNIDVAERHSPTALVSTAAIAKIFLLVSLAFTVTNFVPISVSFVVFALLVAPLFLWRLVFSKVDLSIWFLCLLYFYFGLWVFVYSPGLLFDYGFYRRDGNFFVTFLPLLVFPFFSFKFDLQRLCRVFIVWALVVSLASYFAYLSSPGEPIFHGMFVAHNAAGGYFAMLAALSFGMYASQRRSKDLIAVGIFSFLLLQTDSRGSILGFLLACAVAHPFVRRFRWSFFGITLVICILVVASYAHPIWIIHGRAESGFELPYATFSLPVDRLHTVVDRLFFLWPRAVEVWFDSPIFGIGFGAYNDTPYILKGWPGKLLVNQPSEFIASDWHSHNTFLHVLAETGAVGLVLLVAFLKSLDSYIARLRLREFRLVLQLPLWVAIWSSFTEHRLFTPSQMLPFTLLLAFVLANDRWHRFRAPYAGRAPQC